MPKGSGSRYKKTQLLASSARGMCQLEKPEDCKRDRVKKPDLEQFFLMVKYVIWRHNWPITDKLVFLHQSTAHDCSIKYQLIYITAVYLNTLTIKNALRWIVNLFIYALLYIITNFSEIGTKLKRPQYTEQVV